MKSARSIAILSFAAVFTACAKKDAATGDSAAAAATPEATTPATSGAEPTANEISNYKLDMDKMQKYGAAMKGFQSLSAADSSALEAVGSNANESMAETISRIKSSPIATKVLRDAGLSAEDYVWITAAWLQAAMTEAVLASSKDAKLPDGQNPQNVEFVRAHRAELETLMGPTR